MSITLERTIALAAEAHGGQVDKGGAPYILHPLRVMLAQATIEAKIVGVMHDVIEDGEGWGFERLAAEGFTDEMIEALRSVTKVEGEEYEDFVRRAAANPIGRLVKLADLRDNLDLGRIPVPAAEDLRRAEKYKAAVKLLEGNEMTASRFTTFSLPLPNSFPAGTSFFELDAVPVISDPLGFCSTLDGSFCSAKMLEDGGRPLWEADFRALVDKFNEVNPYGKDGLTDGQRKLRQGLAKLRSGTYKMDAESFKKQLEQQRLEEIEQGKDSPKMGWPEE